MKKNVRVELADGSRIGRADEFGTVIGFHADAKGDGLRSGWRVTWDTGNTGVYAEHRLRAV